ncbi:hypothetical protein [Aquitalea denitrificans]|nr:hypothetical protein [Aquitalea denitrificans]
MRYIVFIRIEHDVIEDGVRFELEDMEYKIEQFLKYQFEHFMPNSNPYRPTDSPHALWSVSCSVLG